MYYHKTKPGAAAVEHLREFIIKSFEVKELKHIEQEYLKDKKQKEIQNKQAEKAAKKELKKAKKELLSIKLPNLNKILKEESLDIMITNDLTEMEQQIYDLLVDGNSYEEVANIIQRKLSSVKTHVASIFDKKQVNSLQKLIVKHYKEKISQYENQEKTENSFDFNLSLLNKLF